MATLKLVLDKRRQKKDGTYPLVFTTLVDSKPLRIGTGVCIPEELINEQTGIIEGQSKLSAALFKLEADYLKRLQLFILSNPNNNCLKTLKNYLLNKSPDELTIKEYWQKVIDDLVSKKRLGGAKVHKQSMATIGRYTNLDMPFKDFSYRNLLELEKNMHVTGISINGMGVYFRSLRTIFNMAINEDLISVEWYPFRKYKIRKEKTSPRVLSKAELKTYFNWTIPASHPEYSFWNIGKLLFMLRGINITDLLLLSDTNLKNDSIIYRRSKTGKLYSIKLNNDIKEVLFQFTSTSTLLGLVELKDMNNSRRIENLVQRRKVINHHLTKIGKLLGLREKLTTYVFRYSYANLAKQMGYSKDIIAEALGHEYGNAVTGIYLEQFDQEIVDRMNQALIEILLPEKKII
ncbi:MAG: hypothetical protein RLZZ38_1706 [Bacteroidota bacterium]